MALPPGSWLGTLQVVERSGETPLGTVYVVQEGEGGPKSTCTLAREEGRGGWEPLQSDVALAQLLSHKALRPLSGLRREGPHLLVLSDLPQGPSLRQMIEKKRRNQGQPLSLKGAYNIIGQVCNYLTYVHGALAHGALTPDFIEVGGTGVVRVFGLGLGRLLAPERLAALDAETAACVAPERLSGAPPAPAADVYSVGAIFYSCVTGQPYAAGAPLPSQLQPELPTTVDQVLLRCLDADPARRFPSPQIFKEALFQAIEGGAKSTSAMPILNLRGGQPTQVPQPKVSVQMPAVVAPPATPKAPTTPAGPPEVVAATSGPRANMADSPPKGAPPAPPGATPSGGLPPAGPPGAFPSAPRPPVPRASAGFPMTPPPLGSGGNPVVPRPSGGGAEVDEDHERWLIQKEDKMDYGPFPLREVRSQIEKGTVHADHFILDMETGDRRRLREHAVLGEMAREWHAKHAAFDLEMKDRASKEKHRQSVQKLLAGIFITVLVVGAGVGGYFKFIYKPEVKTVVVKEQSADDFFKGVQISMQVDPPKKKVGGAKRKAGAKNGAFDDSTSMDAGEEGGDETLTGEQVSGVMNKNFRVLGGCLKEEAGRNPNVRKLDIDFLIRGSTGKVYSVKVNGETGSQVASCVFAKMQSVEFPKFNGQKTHAAFSLGLK